MKLVYRLVGPIVFVALVTLWWFASAGSTDPFFPPLHDIVDRFREVWLFSHVGSDLWPSMWRMAVGYLVGVVVAVVAGLFIGVHSRVRDALIPFIDFMRSLPSTALIPMMIVLIGIGSGGKVTLIALGCVWPVLLNTISAAANLEVLWLQTAQAYGIRGWRYVVKVLVPGTTPQILAGARTSLAIALIMVVVTEMIGSVNGLGHFVIQAQRTFAIGDMWAGVVLIGLIGFVLNAFFERFERWVMRPYGPRGVSGS